jgi:tRNA A-37 threonylcarbamoyl transferase component Bud32
MNPNCKQCQQPLPVDAPEGLCPACLAKVALGTEPTTFGATINVNPMAEAAAAAETRVAPEVAQLAAQFPQLEIIELLGMGGMGMVYKARQPRLDRFVALKILPVESQQHPSFAERFGREAKALAKLNHPGIVNVYDFGQTGQYYYFVMEYVDGMNLRHLLHNQPLEPRQALELVKQICTALQYAHDEGVVHRDIKPENILLNKKGQVKIADFGLAKLLGTAPDTALTMSQAAMGTLNYMAPEQRQNAQTVDHRADIYSLGVVFYEMLTGEVPMGRFDPPSKKVQVDVRLDEVVLKALEREPARRYQHASEVKTDLHNVTSTPNSAAAVAHGAMVYPSTGRPWPAWVWWTLLILVTLPFFQTAELNRAEAMAGHDPKYGMIGPLSLVLLALGAFAIIKLVELRLAKAPTPQAPFSQAWLGIIVAVLAACLIAIGPFPYVEWRHETLKVFPTKVANASGASVELAEFSQVFVKHGSKFWEGRAIALISLISCALLLILPRRLWWNVVRSVMLLGAGVAIIVLAVEFELHRVPDSFTTMPALEYQAKTDPRIQQFLDDFRRHKQSQAADKNVPPETMEKVADTYGGAFREDRPASGSAVCAYAALVLMILGGNTFRQTTKSSPAAFASFHGAVERWSSLLWLAVCLISVWSATIPGWMEEIAYLPLLGGEVWNGDWVKESRLYLAGVDFWEGKIIAATCLVAIVMVIATALQRWSRMVRAVTLCVAGLVSMACAVHFVKTYVQDSTTISWEDFHAVAQHGATAARSAETRQFLSGHARYVGQLDELEKNFQAVVAKFTNSDPAEFLPKETVKTNADGRTVVRTITYPPIPAEIRKAQARTLAHGGGVAGLYQSARSGPQWQLLCGLGLVLLGIRDGYRAWRHNSFSVKRTA